MVSPNPVINILLILICLLLRFSTGHSLQDSVVKKSTVGTAVKLQAAERRSAKAEEEMEERTRMGGGGRKMESGRVGEEASSTSTTSGRVSCIGSGESKGGGVKRKMSKGMRVKMSGFVSWNADYHVPGTHPPRNN